jgi:hypothetical protein
MSEYRVSLAEALAVPSRLRLEKARVAIADGTQEYAWTGRSPCAGGACLYGPVLGLPRGYYLFDYHAKFPNGCYLNDIYSPLRTYIVTCDGHSGSMRAMNVHKAHHACVGELCDDPEHVPPSLPFIASYVDMLQIT